MSWLLGLALAGLVALGARQRPRFSRSRRATSDAITAGARDELATHAAIEEATTAREVATREGIWLWGVWFLVQAIVFSFANFFHLYYLVMLMPALCALVGIGIAVMVEDCIDRRAWGWLLFAALPVAALVQVPLLRYFPNWQPWLLWVMVGGVGSAMIVVFVLCMSKRGRSIVPVSGETSMGRATPRRAIATRIAASVGLAALLLAPAGWSLDTLTPEHNIDFPVAGPMLGSKYLQVFSNKFVPDVQTLEILAKDQSGTRYLAATLSSFAAAPLILATGKPVMALGGYSGSTHILTLMQVQDMVHRGEIRYFVMSSYKLSQQLPPLTPGLSWDETLARFDSFALDTTVRQVDVWVIDNCHWKWQGSWEATDGSGQSFYETIFDCAGAPA